MRGFFFTLVLLTAVVLGLGFPLGWFHVSARHDASSDDIRVTFDINRGKIEQDVKKARAQIDQAAQRVAAGAKEAAGKVGAAMQAGQRAKGQVLKVDEAEARLTIHTEDDQTLTVQAEPSTKIRRNGVDVNMDSLTEGDRVLVLYREENGKKVAQSIAVQPDTE